MLNRNGGILKDGDIYLYLKTVCAELQSQIKNLTKTKSHMYTDVNS
jgi:hypothetical protein